MMVGTSLMLLINGNQNKKEKRDVLWVMVIHWALAFLQELIIILTIDFQLYKTSLMHKQLFHLKQEWLHIGTNLRSTLTILVDLDQATTLDICSLKQLLGLHYWHVETGKTHYNIKVDCTHSLFGLFKSGLSAIWSKLTI